MTTKWSLLLLLGACADHVQPDDPPTATLTGIVEIENGIENATVFIDFNNDNLLDSYEPRATTDATGHFTLTWENTGPLYANTVGAIATSQSGFELHMRAPLGDTSGEYVGNAVISPLTTLVVSEMSTLTREAAEAKIAGALTASQMPFSGPIDVMADYTTSTNGRELRLVASAIGAIVSTSVAKCNELQSFTECNDAMLFDPAIVAMDRQLTTIASGTYKFTQMTAAQQADVQENPGNYRSLFMDTTALADAIEDELIAFALDLLADLFDFIKEELVAALQQAVTEMVIDALFELI